MSSVLYLFPIADEPGAFAWARVRSGGRSEFGRLDAQSGAAAVSADQVVLIAPGEDVTLHAVDLPTRSDAQARRAAGFAIEDDLAQSLEDVHVLLSRRDAKADRAAPREIAIVSRDRLEGWREQLAGLDLAPELVVPDYAALPADGGRACVVDLGDRVLMRAPGMGFAVAAALAPDVVCATLAGRPELGVDLYSDRSDVLVPLNLRVGRDVAVHAGRSDEDFVAMLHAVLSAGPAIDLAAAWRAGKTGGSFSLGPWRAAAGLATAAALASVGVMVAETIAFDRHARATRADAERLLQETFPQIERVVNPQAQLRAQLDMVGGGGTRFLELSAVLAGALAEIDTVQVDSLRFDETDGLLTASIEYRDYADIERLRAEVEARGGALSEGASRMNGGRMNGEVVVAGR